MVTRTNTPKIQNSTSERQVLRLMDGVSSAQKRRILSQMETVDLTEGEVLATQGDHGREFYLLVDGSVQVHRDGTELAVIDEGDFFGEISALTNARRTATVIASKDITVEVMNRRQLATVLDLWPALASRVQVAAKERLDAVS